MDLIEEPYHLSFRVHLAPDLEANLIAVCRLTVKTRETIVQGALRHYLEKNKNNAWPSDFFDFTADKSITAFEEARTEDLPERDDIFEGDTTS